MVVVVVLKGEVFVFGVVGLVVFLVGIVQQHEINDTYIFFLAGDVVEKMMKKCTYF